MFNIHKECANIFIILFILHQTQIQTKNILQQQNIIKITLQNIMHYIKI